MKSVLLQDVCAMLSRESESATRASRASPPPPPTEAPQQFEFLYTFSVLRLSASCKCGLILTVIIIIIMSQSGVTDSQRQSSPPPPPVSAGRGKVRTWRARSRAGASGTAGAGYWVPSLNLVALCQTPHSVSGRLFQRYPCVLGAVSLKAFALLFAMPAWLAIFCVQLCLLAATAFVVEQPNAGPTSGGRVITIQNGIDWNPFWTPVIKLQGMQIAATDWVVNNTEGKIRIKVPPGPGCEDHFLTVWSNCTANCTSDGNDNDGLVLRLNTTLKYEPPSISMIQPALAQFGTSDDDMRTMIINGTNFGKICPDIPTVQVSS
jgi:hypothetical protein